jgi:hypothetical protein
MSAPAGAPAWARHWRALAGVIRFGWDARRSGRSGSHVMPPHADTGVAAGYGSAFSFLPLHASTLASRVQSRDLAWRLGHSLPAHAFAAFACAVIAQGFPGTRPRAPSRMARRCAVAGPLVGGFLLPLLTAHRSCPPLVGNCEHLPPLPMPISPTMLEAPHPVPPLLWGIGLRANAFSAIDPGKRSGPWHL